ncbi:28S ribosomal protein S33, mitochondrial-like [Oppia nitens]|uniref:28S ribosomal protein S33, mitochondrial-like n=1 Tax=Oppia nitens TaxID=1686743 RepID=UPI0023D9D809|nr:28S ribosomal protein S33, mitochondrial-like [Oppia nitens]
MSSRYKQRMVQLSARIFGEYRRPDLPSELTRDRIYDEKVRHAWHSYHHRNEVVIKKLSALPMDLDCHRNHLYYPPHPQHVDLIDKLRELGLFRDEHLDFKDEIERQKILRGKRIWKYEPKNKKN